MMLRQLQQQQQYSPAGASDSSGFSERDSSVMSVGRPSIGIFQGDQPPRSGSPSLFSYHNPTLTASPYSTLPRRPTATATVTQLHSPGANRVNRPLNLRGSPMSLELSSNYNANNTGGFGRAFQMPVALQQQQQQKSNTLPMNLQHQQQPVKVLQKITARTPLLEDDRESCV